MQAAPLARRGRFDSAQARADIDSDPTSTRGRGRDGEAVYGEEAGLGAGGKGVGFTRPAIQAAPLARRGRFDLRGSRRRRSRL
jgi:hypothetical protein